MRFREAALVRYKDFIISLTEGTPATVEFDFEAVWQFKSCIPDFHPEHLRFFHVHPGPGFIRCSTTDIDCLYGLEQAFGYPIHYGIIAFENSNPGDTYSNWAVWSLTRDDDGKIRKPLCVHPASDRRGYLYEPPTVQDLLYLKHLAYPVSESQDILDYV